jgi:hypothetical protein
MRCLSATDAESGDAKRRCIGMPPPTLQELDSAIAEAEQVRARHDGVHVIHGCVTALRMCRFLALEGEWPPSAERAFHATIAKIRGIDRSGFAPRPKFQLELV